MDELERYKRFVFVAAHELKAPLAAIEWGLSELLGDDALMSSLKEDQRAMLRAIEEKNKSLIALTADLLRIAKIQEEDKKSVRDTVDVASIAEQVAESLRPLATKINVELSILITKKHLPRAIGETDALKEIFNNLISNAIRYNKNNGSVSIDGDMRGGEVIIHVRDTGIGIGEDQLNNLFKEFSRIKTEETKHIEGTGLGLFITKQLVERMNGRIWVESRKGEGSAFSFSLPVAGKL